MFYLTHNIYSFAHDIKCVLYSLIRQSWYGRHRNPIHAHHVTKVGDKEFINWQVLAMDKEKDKFWATVEEEDGGIFDCLGMFEE